MIKEITSQVLGKIIQDAKYEDRFKIENITVPFFDNKLIKSTSIDCKQNATTENGVETNKPLCNFLLMTTVNRNSYSEMVCENSTEILDEMCLHNVSQELANSFPSNVYPKNCLLVSSITF